MLGLLVNIGWLEHQCTRLVDKPGAEHRRAATITVFFGSPPSVPRQTGTAGRGCAHCPTLQCDVARAV